jgi:hypothetical protein
MFVTTRLEENFNAPSSKTMGGSTINLREEEVRRDARELGREASPLSRKEQTNSWGNLKSQIKPFFSPSALAQIEREFWIGIGEG